LVPGTSHLLLSNEGIAELDNVFKFVDKECKWRLMRLERAIQYRRAQEDVLKSINHNSTSVSTTLPKPTEVSVLYYIYKRLMIKKVN